VGLTVFEILGYLEGALRRDSGSGSRDGGSRLCKQDVNSKIDLKKLCDAQQLQLSHVLNIWCHVM